MRVLPKNIPPRDSIWSFGELPQHKIIFSILYCEHNGLLPYSLKKNGGKKGHVVIFKQSWYCLIALKKKWGSEQNKKKKGLMKWRLYELHSNAIASHLGADLFSFKKKIHNIVSFLLEKKKKRKRSEWIKDAWWNVNYIAKQLPHIVRLKNFAATW